MTIFPFDIVSEIIGGRGRDVGARGLGVARAREAVDESIGTAWDDETTAGTVVAFVAFLRPSLLVSARPFVRDAEEGGLTGNFPP